MDTAPLSSDARAAGRAPAPAPSSQDASANAATDFETFLTLLTAQMRNQDPLQPMDSTEFVSQLASFSAVEQQIESNVRLDALIDAVAGGSGAGVAEWIGREVKVAAAARYDEQPLELSVDPPEGAAAAALVVYDDAGEVVGRLPIDPSADRLTWDGAITNGTAPPGVYRFEVDYADGEGFFETRAVEVFSTVSEIRFEGGDPVLVLDSGAEAWPDAVTAVREPRPEA